MKKNNKGFSLVELIIVIAIMAVLIGLLAPQYLKFVKKSKVSADISNAQALATAFNVAFADGSITASTGYTGNAGSQITNVSAQWPQIKVSASGAWTVDVGNDGVSAVKIGADTLYPVPGGQWAQ
ncbi:MAG: type II secretion system protein [Acetatifactor sp.]